MKVRLLAWWEALHTSFWLVPILMTTAAVGLSFGTIHLDQQFKNKWGVAGGWLWNGEPEGARAVLSAIATSMITVTSLVFTMTLVVLTLATQKFGPRLLGSFMRDSGTQITLGTFVSTFIYCLLALWAVHSEQAAFVPRISVLCGLLLTLISTGVLIYFIHHVSSSIQVENLVARVGRELLDTIGRLFPDELKSQTPPQESKSDGRNDQEYDKKDKDEWSCEAEENVVRARESNILQSVNVEGLVQLAHEHDLCFKTRYRPGEFVLQGNVLLLMSPAQQPDDEKPNTKRAASKPHLGKDDTEKLTKALQAAFVMGPYRTATQDPEYSVQQLVEVALRALSPGINEPFTAIKCPDSQSS